jgi:predicted DNA-binding transcriptional regulator AlpA
MRAGSNAEEFAMPARPKKKGKLTPRAPYKLGASRPGPVLRKPEAMAFVGYGETQFDLKVANGELPQPISLADSGRSLAWLRSEMEAWLKSRIARRDAELAQQHKQRVA